MEALRMLQVSTYLFALTALGGIVMGWIRFSSGGNPPSWLAMAHGFLAAAGLTLLAYAVLMFDTSSLSLVSLVLFAAASAGGIVLNLAYHLKGTPMPKSVVVAHAVAAIIAFICLALSAFTGG